MRGSISNLIYYLLVFALQVIVGNHFDGWAWLHFCFIPLILILPQFFGILGVEMAQACADVLSLIVALPMAFSELRKF